MTAWLIKVPPSTVLTDDQFYDLCRVNPDIKIERTAQGEWLFMPPIGGETGKRNATLTSRFVVWNKATDAGEVFRLINLLQAAQWGRTISRCGLDLSVLAGKLYHCQLSKGIKELENEGVAWLKQYSISSIHE